jgi:hypothetical protein
MLYSTKNSVWQCRFRPVTQITTVALAHQFSVNDLQDLDFLTPSKGAFVGHAIKLKFLRLEHGHGITLFADDTVACVPHTEWPPGHAVVSTAIECCHGVPIASGPVHPASSDSDGGWRNL